MSDPLDFEQRQRAVELEEWVVDAPEEAAHRIVALEARVKELTDYRSALWIDVSRATARADAAEASLHLVQSEPTEADALVWRDRLRESERGLRRVTKARQQLTNAYKKQAKRIPDPDDVRSAADALEGIPDYEGVCRRLRATLGQ